MGERSHREDMQNGWMHVHLQPQVLGELKFGIDLLFEGRVIRVRGLGARVAGGAWRQVAM
jgi:hypothetical protein